MSSPSCFCFCVSSNPSHYSNISKRSRSALKICPTRNPKDIYKASRRTTVYNSASTDSNGFSTSTSSDSSHVPDTDTQEQQRRHTLLSNVSSAIPTPSEPTTVEVEFAPNRIARFETGRIARQAAGSVIIRVGDTITFCTACADKNVSPSTDFLPLRVDYSEKFSSLGRTSGSYIKREGRPSEREILVSRLIDRSLRPMFQTGYFNEVQVLANVFSYDSIHPADAMAICGTAAALHISHIPLFAPVAGVRLAFVDGEFVIEPTIEETKRAASELVVAGTRDAILMIEGFCDFLTEDQIIQGVREAHKSIIKLCDAIEELREKTGARPKIVDNLRLIPSQLIKQMTELAAGIDQALAVTLKKERENRIREVKGHVFDVLKPSREEELQDPNAATEKLTLLNMAWKEVVSQRMRRKIFDENIRPDGRDSSTVRPITIDQSVLPGAHGSSLFTRGETQTLAVATLGGDDMAQRFETLEGEDAARFYLQYSFPPFSVGEVGRIGAPGRREIGHGKLAERAIMAALPSRDDFPYVMRLESNILESNGSSSMASVCGATLALFDAGVPLSSSVAGVAMGLVIDTEDTDDNQAENPRAVILTDILGLEDALGCCDAKFAGNRHGISALQLDVKLRGISIELLSSLLEKAKHGRHHVLDCMDLVMPKPRKTLPSALPKMEVMQIPTTSIGEVIGQGGKTIRSIIDRCGGEDTIRISVDNDGRVSISSIDDGMIKKAEASILALVNPVKVGTLIKGKVTKILPFGAYVELAEGREGWLHISELEAKRTNNVTDVCNIGDVVEVKVIETGRNGHFRVSRKACLPKPSDNNAKAL